MTNNLTAEEFFETLQESEAKTLENLKKLTPKKLTVQTFEDFTKTLNQKSTQFELPDAFDICGTGGSGLPRINLSTALALNLKSKFTIAKHGNKAASGKIGSFDLIEALGLEVCDSPSKAIQQINKTNVAFLFAPAFHPALKPLAPLRMKFGEPTIFNYLGPILNPVSNLKAQVIGVSNPDMGELIAATCASLGQKALIVHDLDQGLDDVSITGKTQCWEVLDFIKKHTFTPEFHGFQRATSDQIKGGKTIAENKAIFENLLNGAAPKEHQNFLNINQKVAEEFFEKVIALPS